MARNANQLAAQLNEDWIDYLERVDSFRPALHALFLLLVPSVWEAEDLLRKTLEVGFARVARGGVDLADPKALRHLLARVGAGLWRDRARVSPEVAREQALVAVAGAFELPC